MNAGTRGYDSELQMFVEEPRELDLRRLRFLRWLGERGRLEHGVAGAPSGIYAEYDQPERPTAA